VVPWSRQQGREKWAVCGTPSSMIHHRFRLFIKNVCHVKRRIDEITGKPDG